MSLRCIFNQCLGYELASGSQLAFYQDLSNGGWNLGLGPEFDISSSGLPPNIRLIDSAGDKYSMYTVICDRCSSKLGKVGKINGFDSPSVNFSAKSVCLLKSKSNPLSVVNGTKWSKIITSFPNIRQLKATIPESVSIAGSDTVHFRGFAEMDDMIHAATDVSTRAKLFPRRYQWRSFFFGCVNNVKIRFA